jgi:hypothetical protein
MNIEIRDAALQARIQKQPGAPLIAPSAMSGRALDIAGASASMKTRTCFQRGGSDNEH